MNFYHIWLLKIHYLKLYFHSLLDVRTEQWIFYCSFDFEKQLFESLLFIINLILDIFYFEKTIQTISFHDMLFFLLLNI